jgi:hypothetical protein
MLAQSNCKPKREAREGHHRRPRSNDAALTANKEPPLLVTEGGRQGSSRAGFP